MELFRNSAERWFDSKLRSTVAKVYILKELERRSLSFTGSKRIYLDRRGGRNFWRWNWRFFRVDYIWKRKDFAMDSQLSLQMGLEITSGSLYQQKLKKQIKTFESGMRQIWGIWKIDESESGRFYWKQALLILWFFQPQWVVEVFCHKEIKVAEARKNNFKLC